MGTQPEVVVTTLAERPALAEELFAMPDSWPEFMLHDPVATAYFGRVPQEFPHLCLVATLGDQPVARGLAAPFALHTERRGGVLPPGGWDQVLLWAFRDLRQGVAPDTASALEIAVHPDHLGSGLSHRMVAAMREATAAAGLRELVAPVRPNEKHREPHVPMTDYAFRTRDDGLPVDAWLRTHVRAGATIESVAPTSMLIGGTLAEWRERTSLPFDAGDGDVDVVVPGALVPVHCRPAHDYAVYVEPNVWVRHRI